MSPLNLFSITPQCSTCTMFVTFTDWLFIGFETICSALTGLCYGKEELGFPALLILLECCIINTCVADISQWFHYSWKGTHEQSGSSMCLSFFCSVLNWWRWIYIRFSTFIRFLQDIPFATLFCSVLNLETWICFRIMRFGLALQLFYCFS
jgi:hypothetical protein